ncbi:TorF family putative porin [Pseudoxanthomonas mexicana]|uniref:TorF family putative porin n=1 Tax=Pseudoxanthomonas mexicana TaxID=128785 RepID=UPI00398ADD3F
MKPVKCHIAVAAAAALALSPFAALAQDAGDDASPISWELTAVSDYMFRGASQSDENPTGQAGITYTAPFGLYAGAWASGVDFGENKPDFEVDLFVGYNVDFSDSVNFDIAFNRYGYVDAGKQNYNELITTTTFADTYSLTVAYTDDVWASGTDCWYYGLGAEWGFGNDYTFGVNVGRSTFDDDSLAEDYTDWGVSFGKSWGLVSAKLGYVGTDGKGKDNFGELADSRVVLTLSVGQ